MTTTRRSTKLIGWSDSTAMEFELYVATGIVMMALLPWLVRLFALGQAPVTGVVIGSATTA